MSIPERSSNAAARRSFATLATRVLKASLKTECTAIGFRLGLEVRGAPFALMTVRSP